MPSLIVTVESSNGDPISNAEFGGDAVTNQPPPRSSGDGKYSVSYEKIGTVEVKAPGYDDGTFNIEPFMEEYTIKLNPSVTGGS